MPCPPSPLLFDPSLTLEDHSVTEIAGGPGQIQVAGDGCRSQGPHNVEKTCAPFPQHGLATANGKPEPTSISWQFILGLFTAFGFELSILQTSVSLIISHWTGTALTTLFPSGLESAVDKHNPSLYDDKLVFKFWDFLRGRAWGAPCLWDAVPVGDIYTGTSEPWAEIHVDV